MNKSEATYVKKYNVYNRPRALTNIPKYPSLYSMKEKIITIKVNGAFKDNGLKLIVRVKSNEKSMENYVYGLMVLTYNMKASGLKNVLNYGTKKANDDMQKELDEVSK